MRTLFMKTSRSGAIQFSPVVAKFLQLWEYTNIQITISYSTVITASKRHL